MAYDGSGFRGFAAQAGLPTVAGALAGAIARAARLAGPPAIVCAGRTDAGVHATGQVVHVDLPADFDGDLARAVNRQLSPSIVVRIAEPVGDDFDARRSAIARRYRYLVWNAPIPEPLLARVAWHVPEPLDTKAMAAAADALLGEHDFRAFCRRPAGRPASEPIVRTVTAAGWRTVEVAGILGGRALPGDGSQGPVLLRFDVAAGSFCHQMVRSVVAVLVDAGRGRVNVATVVGLLAAGSRERSPQPAPPHGLCLVDVDYRAWREPGPGAAEGQRRTQQGTPSQRAQPMRQ
ncbi:MAG: tRNA pseudouridine(38-40) synthase TruA [Actinomycetota bacterium]|nr:tRNA pseudouridine(38-40) synthase TruA [Actinomycetota bacterium]